MRNRTQLKHGGKRHGFRHMAVFATVILVAAALFVSPLVVLQSAKNYHFVHDAFATEKRLYRQARQLAVAGYDYASRTYATVFTGSVERPKVRRLLSASVCAEPHQVLGGNSLGSMTQETKKARFLTGRHIHCAVPKIAKTPLPQADVPASPASMLPVSNAPLNVAEERISLAAPVQGIQPASSLSSSLAPLMKPLRDMADCSAGTSLDIVAHEDDDILFMNPDIMTDIRAGMCVRTVYLTAGDAGGAAQYWSGREAGAKAAYAAMAGLPDDWQDKAELIDGRPVAVSHLVGHPQTALVFLRLPDGNMHGKGFTANQHESLASLLGGTQLNIHTVDTHEAYDKNQLIRVLGAIMNSDKPDIIRALGLQTMADGDHSDHVSAGTFAALAAAGYDRPHALTAYGGYPDKLQVPDLTAEQIAQKQAVFLAYAAHDPAVCQTAAACASSDTYGNYLTREYKSDAVQPSL